MGEPFAMTTFAFRRPDASAFQRFPLTVLKRLTASSGMRKDVLCLAPLLARAISFVPTCTRIAVRALQAAALTRAALGPAKEVQHDRDETKRPPSI